LHQIDVALFELQYPHEGIGYDSEYDPAKGGLLFPVVRISSKRDLLARLCRFQHKRTGPWRSLRRPGGICWRSRGYDSEGELLDERRMRRKEMETELVSRCLFDGAKGLQIAAFRRAILGIQYRFIGEFYVRSSKRLAILKFDIPA